jgi:polyphosphate kinase
MKRNLDGRIEVLAPVRPPELKQELASLLDLLLNDTRQAWRLHDSTWTRDSSITTPGVQALLLAGPA